MIDKYIPSQIEPKWQKKWREEKIYEPDLDKASKPFYNLMMFPYPSAEGMHVGNMYAFTGSDIYGRFKRMQGFNVFEPIGLDGFGIHSENYALKVGRHPKEQAKISQENFYRQLHAIGNGFDWSRTVETYDPDYYKWTQWIFTQLYKKGLAYRKKAPVNYCPSCKTVLADEQVVEGVCERCSTEVVKKDLEQWFFKITDYAQKLLDDLNSLDWSEKVKIAQKNWIGKSVGAEIEFRIENSELRINVFTTRPDTIFGVTYLVLAPDNPIVEKITIPEEKEEVQNYITKTKSMSDIKKIEVGREKTGVFTGSFALNPASGEKIPVWIADYVVTTYGTGAIMAVPAHDQRDFEFAKKFDLPIKEVISPVGDENFLAQEGSVPGFPPASATLKFAYTGLGEIINSNDLNGTKVPAEMERILDWIEKKGIGKRKVQFHLRDWLVSRQRYWGAPIPIVYCEKCGPQPIKEKDLPLLLPDVSDWKPKGTGKSPLASVPSFVKTICPKCGGPAKRETDVCDTFLDSSWYYFRYTSTEFKDKAFDRARVKKWLPVDMYIGGAEHAVLHLLYSRFISMVIKDLGLTDFDEPFKRFWAHGLIISGGAKMSKSRGNVINPDEYVRQYGADTLRMYLMFMGPFTEGGDFRDGAIEGIYRFLTRIWQITQSIANKEQTKEELNILHKTIKRVTEDLENLRYNTAISALMELSNFISRQNSAGKETLKSLILMLAPFAPHIAEELWARLGEKFSVNITNWPSFNEKYLVVENVKIIVQVNGKLRDTITVSALEVADQAKIESEAKKSEKVAKFLEGQIKKVIFVKGKLINFVV